MKRTSRRKVLRAGVSLAGVVSLSGCGGDERDESGRNESTPLESNTVSAATEEPLDRSPGDGIPGVNDGIVTDPRRLASAHEERLTTRSGRLSETRTELDMRTGFEIQSGSINAKIDGDRILAEIRGREHNGSPQVSLRQLYTEDNRLYLRDTFANGPSDRQPEARRFDRTETVVARTRLTGRQRLFRHLETAKITEKATPGIVGVGTEYESQEMFGTVRASADIEQSGLCRRWAVSFDVSANDHHHRRNYLGHLTDVFDTVVERPDWVRDLL